jgi:hypothetical protein
MMGWPGGVNPHGGGLKRGSGIDVLLASESGGGGFVAVLPLVVDVAEQVIAWRAGGQGERPLGGGGGFVRGHGFGITLDRGMAGRAGR